MQCIFIYDSDNIGTSKETEGNFMDTLALILTIIGSLNWGLVGLFKFDLVAWIFGGQDALLSRVIYSVSAVAGLWCITLLFRDNGRDGE